MVSLHLLLVPLSIQGSSPGVFRTQVAIRQIRRYPRSWPSLHQPLHIVYHLSQPQNIVLTVLFRVMDLERQLILTKDNITVNIDTSVYYRIVDAKVAYYTLSNIMASVA